MKLARKRRPFLFITFGTLLIALGLAIVVSAIPQLTPSVMSGRPEVALPVIMPLIVQELAGISLIILGLSICTPLFDPIDIQDESVTLSQQSRINDAKVLTDTATWIRGSYTQGEFWANVLDGRAEAILAGRDLNRGSSKLPEGHNER